MKIRSLLVLFLTIGVLWACETTDPLIRETQIALQIMDYETALESTEQALQEDSSNAVAHYYRGYALGAIAEETESPSDRLRYYEDMRESMDNALQFGDAMESRPGELDEIDEFILNYWAYEHNSAAQIMTDDSTRQATANPEETAIAHFKNATTIQPDSTISFIVLSSLQYQQGQVSEAIDTYEQAMSKMDTPEYEDYEFLISLYFMAEDYEAARNLSLEAMDNYPDEEMFPQFLADSYLETGDSERAMQILRELIAENPDNPQFYFVLGTQLYRTAQQHLDEASSKYQRSYQMEEQLNQLSSAEQEELRQEIEQLRQEAEQAEQQGDELADLAIEEIQNVIELSPDDDNAYNVLGIIYQNRAAALFDKRNNTRDNDLAMELDEQARENLHSSMENYELAAELNPEENEYWHSLFQIYTTLGMDEEAEEAMQKADM